MSAELFTWRNVRLVPILHGRLETAAEVRRAWLDYKPTAVAVELPGSVGAAFKQTCRRLPNLSALVRPREGGADYLIVEPADPLAEAVRSALEDKAAVHFIDAEAPDYPTLDEPWPDSYAVRRIGLAAYAGPFVQSPPAPAPGDDLREATMAARLQEVAKSEERILAVVGLAHLGRLLKLLDAPQAQPLGSARPARAQPANLDPASIPEATSQIPFFLKAYEDWRASGISGPPDRIELIETLIQTAADRLKKESGQEMVAWQHDVIRRFRRNWALLTGSLVPDFYQLVVSAKSVVGDEMAHLVYREAVAYPFTEPHPGWETVRLTGKDLNLKTRKVAFFKPMRRSRPRLRPIPKQPLTQEAYPGQWSELWDQGETVCSFPPEDDLIEGFGKEAGAKALAGLAEANRIVSPFVCSLGDGVDYRETVRRATENRIYVYEERPSSAKLGAVVIIFDSDDGPEERYPWKLTWLGEHKDESDMAFYADQPGQNLVGPQISRCLYGGLVMTYPPLRMFDVWSDPYFNMARNKPERLLLAGADYAEERLIVYIAKEPPTDRIRALVRRMGRQIAFIPIGAFPPAKLNRIRSFHVLSSRQARSWAGDYVAPERGFRSRRE